MHYQAPIKYLIAYINLQLVTGIKKQIISSTISILKMDIFECVLGKNLKGYTFICFWRDLLISKAKTNDFVLKNHMLEKKKKNYFRAPKK